MDISPKQKGKAFFIPFCPNCNLLGYGKVTLVGGIKRGLWLSMYQPRESFFFKLTIFDR
jgi:hypothetical protein